MLKLKVNDEVVITAGKDKGKTGSITKILRNQKKVYVGGANIVKKTMKASQENPNGGIVEVEAPLHISNVSVVSPKTKKATRVRIETKDGKAVRVAVACGTEL